jgi:hypothetical protein
MGCSAIEEEEELNSQGPVSAILLLRIVGNQIAWH